MSLTSWFREYLYIPLGGNRKGRARQILNSMIVFVCTGIWHGANLTFIVWGFFHGVLMSIETLLVKKDSKPPKVLVPLIWFVTMIAVVIGFVIFRADNLAYGMSYIGRMFAFETANEGYRVLMSFLTPSMIVTLVTAVIACCPLVGFINKITEGKKINKVFDVAGYVISLMLLVLCIMSLASNSYNPFIYFRF